jgi:hypothetical protein
MCFEETQHVLWGDAACVLRRRSMCFEETQHVLWGDAACALGRRSMCFGETISIAKIVQRLV